MSYWIAMGAAAMLAATLATAGPATAASEEDKVDLTADGLAAWRGDTGTWIVAGNAHVDPANEERLAPDAGTGVIVNGPDGRTHNLLSTAEFGDVRAHVEFMVPKGSNSGVYFQARYEVQVLDSWGVEVPEHSDCGGIYQRWDEAREPSKGYEGVPPRVNASRAPGEWQTFDVVFRAPRFDAQGNKTANARFVRVVHNGQVVHENVELSGPTRASTYNDEKALGPLMLQGDHGPVAYRNIRIAPVTGLTSSFFAMDTGTKDAAHATPGSQATMLKELGYEGVDHTGFDGLPAMLEAVDEQGLGLFAIYTNVSINPGADGFDAKLKDSLASLKGRGTVLWMPMTSKRHAVSSPEGDADAVAVLRELADLAAEHGVRIALYPHTGCWLERVDDAVRIAKKVNRDNVGATFNLCHWLKVDGGDLEQRLEAAMPHLFVVTINGADGDGAGWDRLIQPLDQGNFDVSRVLATLKRLNYGGPIGLQGYGIGGDVHANLSRSIAAWRRLSEQE